MFTEIAMAAAMQGAAINIDALDWMTGCWQGEAFGGVVEECWQDGAGDRLIGMFQLLNADGQVFSEFFQIAVFEDGPAMKLLHYNPDFTSWEEPGEFTRFVLLEAGPDAAVFEGLTYTRRDDGGVGVDLRMQTAEGVRTESFVLRPTGGQPSLAAPE